MIYHGHLVHPEIWMLWFSFFAAVWFVADKFYRAIRETWDCWYLGFVPEWRFTAYRLFYDGWHHVVHIGPAQFEIHTWHTIFVNKKDDPSHE